MCETFQQAVAEIYHWVDEQILIAQPRCEISGRCCRFREYNHKLYITRVEAELLFQKEAPEENQLQDKSNQQIISAVGEVCPYQQNSLCTARENRPLGCRIYFCDPDHQEKASEITEIALKRLKNVHLKFGKLWEYNELSHFFRSRTS